MKKIVLIAFLTTSLFSACNNAPKTEIKAEEVKTQATTAPENKAPEAKKDTAQMAAVYQCPMNCEKGKTYDKPGKCPKCKMDLKKK